MRKKVRLTIQYPIKSNENFVIPKTGSINGAGDSLPGTINGASCLGWTFCTPMATKLSFVTSCLTTIYEHQIPLKRSSIVTDQVWKAVLVRKVCLSPLAKAIVPVRVEGAQLCTVGLLEQSTDPTHFDGLLVARTLVDTFN